MVQQGESPDDVAVLLDYAEALPSMLVSDEDSTDTYREYLNGLSDRFPYCRYILDKFDADDHPATW